MMSLLQWSKLDTVFKKADGSNTAKALISSEFNCLIILNINKYYWSQNLKLYSSTCAIYILVYVPYIKRTTSIDPWYGNDF